MFSKGRPLGVGSVRGINVLSKAAVISMITIAMMSTSAITANASELSMGTSTSKVMTDHGTISISGNVEVGQIKNEDGTITIKLTPAEDTVNTENSKVTVGAEAESGAEDKVETEEVKVIPFTDIDDSPYKDAIAWAYEKGITNGTSATTFSPKGTITAQQLCVMMARAYFPEETKGMDINQIMVFMGKHAAFPINIVDYKELEYVRYSAYKALFEYNHMEIFDSTLYENGVAPTYEHEILNEYQRMWDGAIDYRPGYDKITREEFVYILHEFVENKEALKPTIPEESILVKLHNDPESIGLAKYIDLINDIPMPIINKFNDLNWKVELDMNIIGPYCQELGYTNVTGLCSYGKKTLFLLSPLSTYHEFGHFYAYAFGLKDKAAELYNLESGDGSCLSEYSKTNKSEYFAEAFDYWISFRDNTDKMNRFKESNPKTYELFETLESNNWKGLSTPIS